MKEQLKRLLKVIRWRFSAKKWKNQRIYINGKMRPVIAETFDFIFVKGIKHGIRKDSRYLKHEHTKK